MVVRVKSPMPSHTPVFNESSSCGLSSGRLGVLIFKVMKVMRRMTSMNSIPNPGPKKLKNIQKSEKFISEKLSDQQQNNQEIQFLRKSIDPVC